MHIALNLPSAAVGADPTKLIEDLAKRKKIKTLGVSMGQGQEIIARKYMAIATVEGQWVLLQNTHLGLNYLSEVWHSFSGQNHHTSACMLLSEISFICPLVWERGGGGGGWLWRERSSHLLHVIHATC